MPKKPKAWWVIYDTLTSEAPSQEECYKIADILYIALARAECLSAKGRK